MAKQIPVAFLFSILSLVNGAPGDEVKCAEARGNGNPSVVDVPDRERLHGFFQKYCY